MADNRPEFSGEIPRIFFTFPGSDDPVEFDLPLAGNQKGGIPIVQLRNLLGELPDDVDVWFSPVLPEVGVTIEPVEEPPEPVSVLDDRLVIDDDTHEVLVEGELMELPLQEYNMLLHMAQRCGSIVSQEEIVVEAWGKLYVGRADDASIAVHVKRLRQRFGPDVGSHIVIVRGRGYKLSETPDGMVRRSIERCLERLAQRGES